MRFYFLFEMSIPPTLFIVLLYGYQPEKLSARSYLLLYTVLSSLPLLLILLVFPSYLYWIEISSSLMVVFGCTLGFMVKTPLYLLHM